MKIPVPARSTIASKFQGSGCVKDDDGLLSYGYKAVWLQEIIDRKGVIVAMTIVPIQVHDLEAARPLVESFPFEPGSSLIMDRGFIDAAWITHLKSDLGVDVTVPLRRNMDVTQTCVSTADNRNLWRDHPTRLGQWFCEMRSQGGNLYWPECPVVESGTLVRWKQKDGQFDEVLFVTTRPGTSAERILETYDQRAEIEESHRQMKQFQGIETLPSKKLTSVVFRILMGVIGYNLLNLFLNSVHCATFEEFSLKTARQKKMVESNPDVILYTKATFAVLRLFRLMPILLNLDQEIREKLARLFKKLDLSPAPT